MSLILVAAPLIIFKLLVVIRSPITLIGRRLLLHLRLWLVLILVEALWLLISKVVLLNVCILWFRLAVHVGATSLLTSRMALLTVRGRTAIIVPIR